MNPRKLIPIVVLALAAAAVWYFYGRKEDAPADGVFGSGTVEATEAHLGFQAAGRLVEVAPREGDRVVAGDLLARLDGAESEARRAQAQSQVAVARAQLAELEAGSRREEIAQARSALTAAGQRVADAERDLARAQQLLAGKAVARETVDKATLALELAQAARNQAAEQVKLVEQGPRRERIESARAAVAQAEAAVHTSDTVLGNLRLEAPFPGVITVRHREPGEILPTGAAVLTLMNPADRWVRIFVPADQLGKVAIGQPASITADTFPGKTYRGEVGFIASEAEFTPKNVQTTEERVRLVYAVKVRIVDDAGLELKPGLPADVRLGGSAAATPETAAQP
jgi:HlyD family secretion protein